MFTMEQVSVRHIIAYSARFAYVQGCMLGPAEVLRDGLVGG